MDDICWEISHLYFKYQNSIVHNSIPKSVKHFFFVIDTVGYILHDIEYIYMVFACHTFVSENSENYTAYLTFKVTMESICSVIRQHFIIFAKC